LEVEKIEYILCPSGKWQTRIMQTLHEAGHALSTRSLAIRCGICSLYGTTEGNSYRQSLYKLQKKGVVVRESTGVYRIGRQEGFPHAGL